jgi:hypothetical protein
MPKYHVTFIVDATTYVQVEADNEEQAKEKAWEQVDHPCLCYQCSNDLEVGDIVELHSCEVMEDD